VCRALTSGHEGTNRNSGPVTLTTQICTTKMLIFQSSWSVLKTDEKENFCTVFVPHDITITRPVRIAYCYISSCTLLSCYGQFMYIAMLLWTVHVHCYLVMDSSCTLLCCYGQFMYIEILLWTVHVHCYLVMDSSCTLLSCYGQT
jgi:hypothetical protein